MNTSISKPFYATILVTLLSSTILFAQSPPADKNSRPSPPATATGKIGEATFTIHYGSPAAKGRKIWGELVPYAKVWRAGANEATIFETDKVVFVEGKKLPAGKYSFYAIPGEKEWQIIINSQTGQWGVKRDGETSRLKENDIITATVRPGKAKSMTERLLYEVNKDGIVLKWENLELPIAVVQCDAKSWNDVNYAGDTLVYHNLDVYLPTTNKSSYPAVLVIYGSAWFGNNAKATAFGVFGKLLLENGFAVITMNHRSSRDAIFPAQINDVKAAIRFIRARAKTYQIDPGFIGITGFSSGGHLSALAGTSGAIKSYSIKSATADLEGTIGEYTSYSSSVDAVVDWFGPTSFQRMDECGSKMKHNDPASPEASLIGGPIQENLDKVALADPITYVDKNDPPFLILHGGADELVPACQSKDLYDALQKAKVRSEFVLVPKAGHGPGLFEENYFKMMTDFFLGIYRK
jgi:acetyl esterase/lipase